MQNSDFILNIMDTRCRSNAAVLRVNSNKADPSQKNKIKQVQNNSIWCILLYVILGSEDTLRMLRRYDRKENFIMEKISDSMKKILLAGIGAAATTAEKSKEILDDLVKKGELTVEQGKVLNEELKHNVKQTFKKDEEKDPADVLKGMSPEQIAALKEAIAQKEAADAAQDDEKEAEEAPYEA